ncbi:uncharacterized protein LOC105832090 [Monomorium pharaonis]|uniref:uncharacterized protein LOC105832090 n=1 Tax=Monomorium pharaonis TaxID=307658 RepID=UPI0017465C06|nr:uncharacterized protein LOC105832090 [Monomorium pharaonis]
MMNTVTTMEQAIHPLVLTFNILGLGVHIPEKLYISIFYNVTLWSAYSYLLYYIIITFELEMLFLATFTAINNVISFLISIISMIMNLYQHKMFKKRLAAVDDTLEELGTCKIYQKLHIFIKRVLIGWLVCTQIMNINDMMWWLRTQDHWYSIIPYIVNHYIHVNMLVALLFITFLWYIGTRFDKLNEHIRNLLLGKEHNVRYTWRKAVWTSNQYIMCINNYKHVLWTTMHLHLELCQLVRELNAMFEIQMTMEMVAHLIFLTRLFRFFIVHITMDVFILSLADWIDVYLWVFLYIAKLFCLNYICESVSAKSNEMNTIIQRLTDFLQYADVRDEIYQFTLQIRRHPLKLSGLGLFYFGNGFLRKFVMSVLTFVIIIIQTPGAFKVFTYMGF